MSDPAPHTAPGRITSASGAAPPGELDARYSSPGAAPTAWSTARRRLAEAELFWLSSVRPDGRPHATPLLAVWRDGALHFSTGENERKALNLAADPRVVLSTGTPAWNEGYDVAVEGEAVRVTDIGLLRALAVDWHDKYGDEWRFEVRDDAAFQGREGPALVFAVEPRTVFGFGKGPFSQTRWRFR